MSGLKPQDISGTTDLRVSRLAPAPGVLIARVEGALDTATAPDFETRLNTFLNPLPQNLLLDFGSVDYMSSMGLSVTLKAAIRLKNGGCGFWLYDPQLSVRRVLEISKWSHIILDPSAVAPDSPFFGYICEEEPVRASRRNKFTSTPPRLYND